MLIKRQGLFALELRRTCTGFREKQKISRLHPCACGSSELDSTYKVVRWTEVHVCCRRAAKTAVVQVCLSLCPHILFSAPTWQIYAKYYLDRNLRRRHVHLEKYKTKNYFCVVMATVLIPISRFSANLFSQKDIFNDASAKSSERSEDASVRSLVLCVEMEHRNTTKT